MTKTASLALLVLALAAPLAGCTPNAAPPAASGATAPRKTPTGRVQHVVFVTIDGLLPDSYVHPDAHGLQIPTLRRLVAAGAASDGAYSVFPTMTYPSHTSMATGLVPGKHGITSNRTFDPLEDDFDGWRWYAEDIHGTPLWDLAMRAGYATALVHWPVSVGARVTWTAPEYWRAKNENDPKLLRVVGTPGLLDAVAAKHPGFWSRYVPAHMQDDALTDIATHLLETGKPTLLMLHLIEVDAEQHHHGVWSPEALAATEKDDRQLARILAALEAAGIARDTSVVIASDHGFMNTTRAVRPGALLRDAGLVTRNAAGHVTEWKATLVVNPGMAYVYLRDPNDTATRDAVRALFAGHVDATGIGRVYEAAEIQSLGGDPAALLALEPSVGCRFLEGYGDTYGPVVVDGGTHGYDPRRPELHASLILYGANVPHGTLRDARLIDIAPTIADWLGLEMPSVDGRRLVVTAAP